MWAFRRRIIIVIVVLLGIGLLVGGAIVLKKLTEQPLCTDNQQNGSETGIDCGGACIRVCVQETRPLFIPWARVVPVTDKVYSVVLEIENKNYDAVAHGITYRCNLLTDDYRRVQQVSGSASVPPAGNYFYAVTGLRFASNDVRPSRAQCTVNNDHEWLRLPKKTTPNPFDYQNTSLQIDDRPSATTTITNTDAFRLFKDVQTVAVIFDATDTVVAVSTSVTDRLPPLETARLVFTWPVSFQGTEPYRVEFRPVFKFPDLLQSTR